VGSRRGLVLSQDVAWQGEARASSGEASRQKKGIDETRELQVMRGEARTGIKAKRDLRQVDGSR
jgi:hypothetical protein